MKADRDPDRGEQIEAGEQGQVGGVDPAVPQQHDRGDNPGERDDDPGQICILFSSGHLGDCMSSNHQVLRINRGTVRDICSPI